jgi:aldehyde dehydrogenase (NAD+)
MATMADDRAPIISSLVGGRHLDTSQRTIRSTNPAHTSSVVVKVRLADADALVLAARAAVAAQAGWAEVPAPVRGEVIANIGRLVEANAEALARLVTREVGKPLAEAQGEAQEIVDTCHFFLGEGRRLYGQTVPSEMPDKQLFGTSQRLPQT